MKQGEIAFNRIVFVSQIDRVKEALPALKRYIHEERNDLKYCPFCHSHIEDRVESIYAELLDGLYRVLRWCEERDVHEFTMKDIRHFMTQSNYARFGNLVHYGGVVYPIVDEKGKRKTGKFGINRARAREVFANKRPFPVAKKIDMITGETIEETCVLIKDIPSLAQYLDAEGNYYPELFGEARERFPSKRKVPAVKI